jgi:hypothetical protein
MARKTVFVVIMLWGGTIEKVKVFRAKEQAQAFKEKMDVKWSQYLDYEGTNIFVESVLKYRKL